MIKIIMFSGYIGNRKNYIGGMDVHQDAFLSNYSNSNNSIVCKWLIVRKFDDYIVYKNDIEINVFKNKSELFLWLSAQCEGDTVFFFNNFTWVDSIKDMKKLFVNVKFVIRSGGNDIYKMMLKMSPKLIEDKVKQMSDIINKHMDKMIINSDYSYFRNLKINILPSKMVKIRGGVNYDWVDENISNRAENRMVFNDIYNTRGKKIFAIVGRMVPFKGILEFLEQLAEMKYNRKWHLVIIGDGCLKEQIISFLCERFNSEAWTYLGQLSNKETMKIISIADLLISSSIEFNESVDNYEFIHTETMGRAIMEAISQNIPILTLKSGGIPEVFYENDFVGYYMKDISDVVHYLEKFILENWKIKGKTADYSWENVFNKYNSLFQSFFKEK